MVSVRAWRARLVAIGYTTDRRSAERRGGGGSSPRYRPAPPSPAPPRRERPPRRIAAQAAAPRRRRRGARRAPFPTHRAPSARRTGRAPGTIVTNKTLRHGYEEVEVDGLHREQRGVQEHHESSPRPWRPTPGRRARHAESNPSPMPRCSIHFPGLCRMPPPLWLRNRLASLESRSYRHHSTCAALATTPPARYRLSRRRPAIIAPVGRSSGVVQREHVRAVVREVVVRERRGDHRVHRPVYTLRSLTVKLACMNRGSTACRLKDACSRRSRSTASARRRTGGTRGGGGAPYQARPCRPPTSPPALLCTRGAWSAIAVRARNPVASRASVAAAVATSVALRLAPATESVPLERCRRTRSNARTRAAPKAVRTTSPARGARRPHGGCREFSGRPRPRARGDRSPPRTTGLVEATADDDHGACTPRAAPNALAPRHASALPRGCAPHQREHPPLSPPRSPRGRACRSSSLHRSSRNLSRECSSRFSFRCDFGLYCPFRPAVILRVCIAPTHPHRTMGDKDGPATGVYSNTDA